MAANQPETQSGAKAGSSRAAGGAPSAEATAAASKQDAGARRMARVPVPLELRDCAPRSPHARAARTRTDSQVIATSR